MKKIAILFSILVVLLLASPGIIGFKAQSHYQEIISSMQLAGLEVTRSDYRRGWFGSQAETEFKLDLPQDMGVDGFTLSMHSEVVHGPLSIDGGLALATIGTYFKVNGRALFPEEGNKVLHSRIGLDGNGTTRIEIPALKLAGEPGKPEIRFSGAEGKLLFDTGFTQLDIDLNIPAFWLGGGEGQSLKIEGVTLESKSKTGLSGLRFGSGRLGIKQIDFVDPKGGMTIKVDSIDMFGDTREEGGNLVFSATYALKTVVVNEKNYGPAELQLDVGNISAAVAAKLQQGIREIRRQNLPQQQQGMAMLSMLVGAGPDLLRANPKIAIKRLFVKTPQGDIEGALSLAADGLQWGEIGNIQALLQKLDADASIRLPEQMLRSVLEIQAKQKIRQHMEMRKNTGEAVDMPSEQEVELLGKSMIEQRLGELFQQEMLVRDGIYVSTSVKLGGGLLSVNGKTIPLNLGK